MAPIAFHVAPDPKTSFALTRDDAAVGGELCHQGGPVGGRAASGRRPAHAASATAACSYTPTTEAQPEGEKETEKEQSPQHLLAQQQSSIGGSNSISSNITDPVVKNDDASHRARGEDGDARLGA